jgi:hypothetical protein
MTQIQTQTQTLPTSDSPEHAALSWAANSAPAPIESVRIVADTARSWVARLSLAPVAEHADLFLKVDRILPPAEAVVLARLAPRWPDHIAPLLAVDESRGWSISHDVGAHGLDGATTADWQRVVDRFARIQRDSGQSAEAWIALGCRDRRGARLLAAIDGLLTDCAPALSREDRQTLDGQRPRIEAACADLAEDGLAPALVHQDLVPVNIVLRESAGTSAVGSAVGSAVETAGEPERVPVFLDWSDTVVGHPFFGCDRLLDACWSDAPRKAAVIDAYLAAFEGAAEPERLRASFQRVLQLRVLYEGVRWRDEIAALDPTDPQAERLRADQLVGLRMMAEFARKQG